MFDVVGGKADLVDFFGLEVELAVVLDEGVGGVGHSQQDDRQLLPPEERHEVFRKDVAGRLEQQVDLLDVHHCRLGEGSFFQLADDLQAGEPHLRLPQQLASDDVLHFGYLLDCVGVELDDIDLHAAKYCVGAEGLTNSGRTCQQEKLIALLVPRQTVPQQLPHSFQLFVSEPELRWHGCSVEH